MNRLSQVCKLPGYGGYVWKIRHERRRMIDVFRLVGMLAAAGLTSVVLQRLAMVRAKPGADFPAFSLGPLLWRTRPVSVAGDLLAAGIGMAMFCLFTLLTARPVASWLILSGMLGLLVIINGAKEKELHEPLVLADACLLGQIVRYPHLYLPYFPLRQLLLLLAAVALLLAMLLVLEPPALSARKPAGAALLLAGAFLPAALLVFMHGGRLVFLARPLLRLCPVSHDAVTDAARNGPLAAAFCHPIEIGRVRRERPDFLRSFTERPEGCRWPFVFFQSAVIGTTGARTGFPEATKPHILLIQAESFFDFRKVLPEGLCPCADFLPNWDALTRKGQTLDPPENAFGAYTMRMEFSLLTGLPAGRIGPWFFNPYLPAARRPFWSLARHYASRGYATLCVHPYARKFFSRDRVMPHLGFERFLGLEDLPSDLPRFGPYISDLALGEYVGKLLDNSSLPVFCFVVTMEAHGPWLPGRLTEEEMADSLGDRYEAMRAVFTLGEIQYLCHIRNTDRMLGLLLAERGKRPRELFVYGDHRPNLQPFGRHSQG